MFVLGLLLIALAVFYAPPSNVLKVIRTAEAETAVSRPSL
jgi:hypothetical protein